MTENGELGVGDESSSKCIIEIAKGTSVAAGRLVVGNHLRSFGSILPPELTESVVAAVNDKHLIRLLESHPLDRLEFSGNVPNPGWYAYYDPCTRDLVVNALRPASSYGQEFIHGEIPTVSHAGSDLSAAMQRSLFHELGHYIVDLLGPRMVDIIRAAGRAGILNPASQRARARGPLEYFAETFATYRFHGETLYHRDPGGYTLVEDILRMAGLL